MNAPKFLPLTAVISFLFLLLASVVRADIPGDIDGDNDVDRDDLDLLLAERNKPVENSDCGARCDLDGDGVITVLDARKLILLCDLPGCESPPPVVNQPPLAADYEYDAVGNLIIDVPASAGLLSNVSDPDGDNVRLALVDSPSANLGSVSANRTTGAFTYLPPAGFRGTDTFTYAVIDDGVPAQTATGTVTINVTDMIWFVDETAASGGDGRLTSPFDCLVGAGCFDPVAADQSGDKIFVADGNYTGGITLLNDQTLVGDGVSGDLASALGVSLPPFSSALPAPSGVKPVLQSTANGIDLARDNTIRGLNIGDTGGTGIAGISAGNLTINETSISGTGGIVDLRFTNLDVTFDSLSSTSSGDGILLEGVQGNLAAPAGSISGSARPFFLAASQANVSYGGSIQSSGGNAVELQFNSTGTVEFSGPISGQGGIRLIANNSTSIGFDGGISLDTGVNDAFTAVGSGTVSVTGINILNTTTGTALNVSDVDIGAAGLNFTSISVDGASTGIRLDDTGGSGGLTVTGSGSSARNGSGGVLANTTGDAISLTDTVNVSLNQIRIQNAAGHAISGTGVGPGPGGGSSFALTNSEIIGQGDVNDENAIDFTTPGAANLSGPVLISNTEVSGFVDTGIDISNISGSLSLAIADSEFRDNDDTFGGEAIAVETTGSAGFRVDIQNSVFEDIENDIIALRAGGSGSHDVNIFDNTSTGGGGPDRFPAGGDIFLSVDGGASMNFDILGNQILDLFGDGIVLVGDGNMQGRIGGPGVSDGNLVSGNGGDGIRIDFDGQRIGGAPFQWNILVQNNSLGTDPMFPGLGDDGIQILNRDGDGTLNLTIEDNTIQGSFSEGLRFFSDRDFPPGSTSRPQSNLRIADNAFVNTGVFGADDLVLRMRDDAAGCFHIVGNDNGAGGSPGLIDLNQGNTSILQITQSSVAALSAANSGATVSTFGILLFNGPCTNPALPSNP